MTGFEEWPGAAGPAEVKVMGSDEFWELILI